jgi:hypothetical protein
VLGYGLFKTQNHPIAYRKASILRGFHFVPSAFCM